MKPCILFFNAENTWSNVATTEDANRWVVGVLEEEGYRNRGCFDCDVEVLSTHDDFESALSAFRALIVNGV